MSKVSQSILKFSMLRDEVNIIYISSRELLRLWRKSAQCEHFSLPAPPITGSD